MLPGEVGVPRVTGEDRGQETGGVWCVGVVWVLPPLLCWSGSCPAQPPDRILRVRKGAEEVIGEARGMTGSFPHSIPEPASPR
jgi:hypothetical protein